MLCFGQWKVGFWSGELSREKKVALATPQPTDYLKPEAAPGDATTRDHDASTQQQSGNETSVRKHCWLGLNRPARFQAAFGEGSFIIFGWRDMGEHSFCAKPGLVES